MDDTLLKTVRVTDNIKLEVYQQGKKRKYALFYDSSKTKSEKYDVALTDDQVIHEALISYNSLYRKSYIVIQDPYKDPMLKRTYGGGTASPYYLNNGCKINILWQGDVPNPEFTGVGTYSTLHDAEKASKKLGKPRYLKDVKITSSEDAADNFDLLPKSSWSVSPPIKESNAEDDPVPTDYRDHSTVQDKIVTLSLPDGIKEEGDYLVWTDGGLQYNTKSIAENTPFESFGIGLDGFGRGGRPTNQIRYFDDEKKDSDIIISVLSDYQSKVTSLYGISYDLKLCSPDTESCSKIEYKSPLKPNETPAAASGTSGSSGVSGSSGTSGSTKIKLIIDGLPDVIELKAKTDLDPFTVWVGEIPKSVELSDDFEDLAEYIETPADIKEEEAAEVNSWNPELERQANNVMKQLGSSNNLDTKNAQAPLPPADPKVKPGKHKLDMLPDKGYKTNSGAPLRLCAIDGAPVNAAIAPAYLDMFAAAKNDGITLAISSGYRDSYVSISDRSEGGVMVSASSQKYLYDSYIAGKPGFNLAAKPQQSNHGNGIGLDLNAGGKSKGRYINVKEKNYEWLVKNSWRFGFVRTVATEEWHYDYRPDIASKGPYAALSATDKGLTSTKFYNKKADGTYWGLDELKIS